MEERGSELGAQSKTGYTDRIGDGRLGRQHLVGKEAVVGMGSLWASRAPSLWKKHGVEGGVVLGGLSR